MSSCNGRNKGNINAKTPKYSKSNTTIPSRTIASKAKKETDIDELIVDDDEHAETTATAFIPNGIKNRRVQGQSIPKQTISKFVSQVIPQTASVNSIPQHEQINWAKIQLCPAGVLGNSINFVIVIGLARGYQLFLSMEDGSFEEVISVRNAPLKIGHLLPFTTKLKDRFSDQRPLMALYAIENGTHLYNVNFLSLLTGKIVHHIKFPKPVVEITSSSNCLLILTNDSISIYEHENFVQRFLIKLPPTTDSSYIPSFSLSENLLAIADSQLDKGLQSVGGCSSVYLNVHSANNQMVNTAKNFTKAVSSISESIVSSFSHTASNKQPNDIQSTNSIGIVSIINVDGRLKKPHNHIVHTSECLSNFRAFSDSPIGHLMFGSGGQLLLAGSLTATVFNVFTLYFHPKSSSLTTVQHIYTLNRGNTAAKVIESAFSFDNRWLTISTNHGTTHLFALNPYGGQTNSRTHGGKFMNKEGKFEKSAGIRINDHTIIHQQLANAKYERTHPGTKNMIIARTVINVGSFAAHFPTLLNSMILIKQRIFSTENLCAWASDNTPYILQPTRRRNGFNGATTREFGRILSARFGSFATIANKPKHSNTVASILVMNNEAVLTEYAVRAVIHKDDMVALRQTNSDRQFPTINSMEEGLTDTTLFNTKNSGWNEQFTVKLSTCLQWELTRSQKTADFELVDPPLPSTNPIIQLYANELAPEHSNEKRTQRRQRSSWLPFLEVITYTGPHRRLWLGPQFSFSIYTPVVQSSELSNSYMSPRQVDGMQKCCPVLIEKNLYNPLAQTSIPGSAARIICGSWSSEFDCKHVNGEMSLVKDKIEDAMKESSKEQQDRKAIFSLEEEQKDEDDEENHLIIRTKEEEEDNDDNDACLMLSGIEL